MDNSMGYGLGILLLVIGLILGLDAINPAIPGVNENLVGWILVLGGILVIAITAIQANTRRQATTTRTTTHSDGSQTTTQARTEQDPPAF